MKIKLFKQVGLFEFANLYIHQDIVFTLSLLSLISDSKTEKRMFNKEIKKMILSNAKIRFNQDLEKRLPIKNIKEKVSKI